MIAGIASVLLLVVSLLLLLASLLLLAHGSGVFVLSVASIALLLSLLVFGVSLSLEVSIVSLQVDAVDVDSLPDEEIVLSSISLIAFNEEATSMFVDCTDVVVVLVCEMFKVLPFDGTFNENRD